MSEGLPPYLNLTSALAVFASGAESVQSQRHIKPLHQHIAMRLVIEGGFEPSEITPRPPLRIDGRDRLVWDAGAATQSEQTVLGGLKTKDIDVVVNKASAGPVIAISVKGTTGAFRNLTNRMEEAIGDSTNLHLMYPGLVYGFFQIIRANHVGTPGLAGPNDIAVDLSGQVVISLRRYHDVLTSLTGRRMVRDDPTRYESLAMAMVSPNPENAGTPLDHYPEPSSPLRVERFFETLLSTYDLRYPYMAASLPGLRRREWSRNSPIFRAFADEVSMISTLGYAPRII